MIGHSQVAIDALGWPKQNVCDVVTSRLWYGQLSDQSGWGARKAGGGAKNVKFSLVHAVLLTHGRVSNRANDKAYDASHLEPDINFKQPKIYCIVQKSSTVLK